MLPRCRFSPPQQLALALDATREVSLALLAASHSMVLLLEMEVEAGLVPLVIREPTSGSPPTWSPSCAQSLPRWGWSLLLTVVFWSWYRCRRGVLCSRHHSDSLRLPGSTPGFLFVPVVGRSPHPSLPFLFLILPSLMIVLHWLLPSSTYPYAKASSALWQCFQACSCLGS